MAWEKNLFAIPGALAGADFSGRNGGTQNGYNNGGSFGTGQFLFVKGGSADLTYVPAGIGDMPAGISQTNPVAGSGTLGDFTSKAVGLEVRVLGISKLMVGAADVAAWAPVGPDANGAAVLRVLTSGGADAGRYWAGYFIEAAKAGTLGTFLIVAPQLIQQ